MIDNGKELGYYVFQVDLDLCGEPEKTLRKLSNLVVCVKEGFESKCGQEQGEVGE